MSELIYTIILMAFSFIFGMALFYLINKIYNKSHNEKTTTIDGEIIYDEDDCDFYLVLNKELINKVKNDKSHKHITLEIRRIGEK